MRRAAILTLCITAALSSGVSMAENKASSSGTPVKGAGGLEQLITAGQAVNNLDAQIDIKEREAKLAELDLKIAETKRKLMALRGETTVSKEQKIKQEILRELQRRLEEQKQELMQQGRLGPAEPGHSPRPGYGGQYSVSDALNVVASIFLDSVYPENGETVAVIRVHGLKIKVRPGSKIRMWKVQKIDPEYVVLKYNNITRKIKITL